LEQNHRHFLATITGIRKIPKDPKDLYNWLLKLVDIAGMHILSLPDCCRCDDLGNEGCTGTVQLKESHASIHVWEAKEIPYAKMDLYSCKDFDTIAIMNHCAEFEPEIIDGVVFDRNGPLPKLIEEHKFIL